MALAAGLLILTVKMCESDGYTTLSKQTKEDVDNFENLQHESDSLLTEVLHEIDVKHHKYTDELDSLNKIITNGSLSSEEIAKLKKKIKDTQKLLEIERSVDFLEMVTEPELRDSVVWNIIEKDSIKWNIIEKDSVVYNIIDNDSVVSRVLYQIDTVYYDSDDVKKLKLKNN